MASRDIIADCCEQHTELYGQNVEVLSANPGGLARDLRVRQPRTRRGCASYIKGRERKMLVREFRLVFKRSFFFFTGEKRPGREVDYLPPSSFEGKNGWCCTFTFDYIPSWRGHGGLQFYLCVLFLAFRESCTVITGASARRGEIMGDRDRQTCRGFLSKGGHVDILNRAQLALSDYLSEVFPVLFSSVVRQMPGCNV